MVQASQFLKGFLANGTLLYLRPRRFEGESGMAGFGWDGTQVFNFNNILMPNLKTTVGSRLTRVTMEIANTNWGSYNVRFLKSCSFFARCLI